MTTVAFVFVACALAASLAVRPWRMLRGDGSPPALATPLLATLVLLPWLWAWPIGANLPVPVQWSGAALAVLMLGWPLAIPLLVGAGLSTMVTAGASFGEAISSVAWLGVLPATAVLVLGHGVRRAFGMHPVAYLLGRAYAVPLVALFGCTLAFTAASGGFTGIDTATGVVAAFLMAMGEAAWTGAVAALLVAWRPRWLATWSDARYLRPRQGPGQA
jgi:uncharacterized membrane protein